MSVEGVSEAQYPQGFWDELQFRARLKHVLFGLAFTLCFLFELNGAYGAYLTFTRPHLGVFAIIIALNVAPVLLYVKGWRWSSYGSLTVPLGGTVWFWWHLFSRAVDRM